MSIGFRFVPNVLRRLAACLALASAGAATVARIGVLVAALGTLGACDSEDDDGEPSDGAADAGPGAAPADDEPDESVGEGVGEGPPTDEPLIGRDNHVDLIAEAFDLYAGRPYAQDLTGIVHPAIRSGAADEVFSVTACDNGGTLRVLGEDRVEFDDCLLGEVVFDGLGEALFNPYGVHVVVDELVAERASVRRLELDGELWRLAGISRTGIDLWATNAATIRLVTPEGSVEVSDASSSFEFGVAVAAEGSEPIYAGRLSGSLTFRSTLTDDRAVRAEIPVDFARPGTSPDERFGADDDFTVGQLRLSAEDGSALVLDAASGDASTVSVEIVVDGESERFVQPWSLWRDRLRFEGPPTRCVRSPNARSRELSAGATGAADDRSACGER